jgi:hypothetical protein
MNPNKKVLFTFLSFVLALLVIACSCSSLIPSSILPSGGGEAMPGLAGTWKDQETSDTFVIAWQGGQYEVTSVTWGTDNYTITAQSWSNSVLSWSYDDTTIGLTVTHTTKSLDGDNLNATWSYSDGRGGDEVLVRVP